MKTHELYSIAEQENVSIFTYTLHAREALSMIDPDGQCFIALDPKQLSSSADEKTKVAHELGHCVTGSFYNVFSSCDDRQRHENKADKWAIKKLIPKDELENAVSKGYTEIWQLAEWFNVTESMIRKAISWYRYGNLYSLR